MTITAKTTSGPQAAVEQLWYTRCPVPTASGLAHNLGWLGEEFAPDGLEIGILQDAPPEIARHHFDHQLLGLFREGGNVPALAARSEGAPSRLIGLTWIEEWQTVVVRPDSGITGPADLRGRRVAVPAWGETRAESFPRAMALRGLEGALSLAGLGLDDVEHVEVAARVRRAPGSDPAASAPWPGLDELMAGEVDAVYVKGGRSAEQVRERGLEVAVDLDQVPDRAVRVNNGTPRPITVHEQLLAERPDLVVRFLVRTLEAATWAAAHPAEVRGIVGREVGSGKLGVATAYGADIHTTLAPDLSEERLRLLGLQKDFLLRNGFLAADFDLAAWAAPEPLAEARAQLEGGAR